MGSRSRAETFPQPSLSPAATPQTTPETVADENDTEFNLVFEAKRKSAYATGLGPGSLRITDLLNNKTEIIPDDPNVVVSRQSSGKDIVDVIEEKNREIERLKEENKELKAQ